MEMTAALVEPNKNGRINKVAVITSGCMKEFHCTVEYLCSLGYTQSSTIYYISEKTYHIHLFEKRRIKSKNHQYDQMDFRGAERCCCVLR